MDIQKLPYFKLGNQISILYVEYICCWLVSFRIEGVDLLPAQVSLMSHVQHHSYKASIVWHSAFLRVKLAHLYISAGKTIALDYMGICWKRDMSSVHCIQACHCFSSQGKGSFRFSALITVPSDIRVLENYLSLFPILPFLFTKTLLLFVPPYFKHQGPTCLLLQRLSFFMWKNLQRDGHVQERELHIPEGKITILIFSCEIQIILYVMEENLHQIFIHELQIINISNMNIGIDLPM